MPLRLKAHAAVLLLLVGGSAAVAQSPDRFEVVTVKPADPSERGGSAVQGRHLLFRNQSVVQLLKFAYDVTEPRIKDAPGWCSTEHFDIAGSLEAGTSESREQMQRLLRAVLAERFALKLHHVQRPMPVFVLQVAPGGPKMKPEDDPAAKPGGDGTRNHMTVRAMTMEQFAAALKYAVDLPVVDETGLRQRFNFDLRWLPDGQASDDPAAPPPLPTALREQLGLKLESARRPVDEIVIDTVQRPSPD